jgi:hypothetical protein
MQRLSPIQQGKFGYAECFEAFVRGMPMDRSIKRNIL